MSNDKLGFLAPLFLGEVLGRGLFFLCRTPRKQIISGRHNEANSLDAHVAQIADMLLIDINKRLIKCIWYRLISYQWFQFATGDRE